MGLNNPTIIPSAIKHSEILVSIDSVNTSGSSYNNLNNAVDFSNSNATKANPIILWVKGRIPVTSTIVLTNPYVTIRGLGTYDSILEISDTLAGNSIIAINYPTVQSVSPLGNLQVLSQEGTTALNTTTGTVAVDIIGKGIHYINTLRIQGFNKGLRANKTNTLDTQVVLVEDNITIRDSSIGLDCGDTSITIAKIVAVDNAVGVKLINKSNITFESGSFSGFRNVKTDTGIFSTGSPIVTLNGIEFSNLDIGIDMESGTWILNSVNIDDTVDADVNTHIIVKGAPKIRTNGSRYDTSKTLLLNTPESFDGNFINYKPGDKSFWITSKLNVGLPDVPRESAFGGGNSYNTAALFYEFNGSTFNDVKPSLLNPDDSNSWSFPNNNTDTALYISNLYQVQFLGLKIELDSIADLGAGDLIFEYWDGSSWFEFNYSVTQSDGEYLPLGNNKLNTETGSFQIRFDDRIQSDWDLNDPISLGIDRYWVRIRIASAITTSPIIDTIKVHSHRTEINEDGYIEFFGNARPIAALPIAYGTFEAASSSPSNSDVYASDNLFAGRKENRFQNNTKDETGIAEIVPFELDTSCPIRTHLMYSGLSDVSGNVYWEITWGFIRPGDDIYTGTDGPTSITNQQEIVGTTSLINTTSYRKLVQLNFDLSVPELITQRTNGQSGDILFINIARDASNVLDTYSGDIAIVDMKFFYTKWKLGGHVISELN